MTQTATKYEGYLSDFEAFEANGAANAPAWIRETRRRAMERFMESGFPTARKGNEKWKYTNVGPIASARFAYPAPSPDGVSLEDIRGVGPWQDSWSNLVFLDGRYAEALSSPNGASATGLADAVSSGSSAAETHLSRYADVEEDAFTALNTAFLHDGAYVHIPEGRHLDTPIHLVFVSTGRGEPSVSYPRVLVVAGPGSRATIIESYVSLETGRSFTNAVAEMVLGEGAEVDHYRLLLEGDSSYHVGTARVRQAAASSFSSGTFEKGPALGRYDLSVLLDGPGSFCELNGLYLTSGSQHMDNLINIDHAKPETTSRLYYKGILDGKSRAVFGGTVLVRQDAQKADARQSDKNLVLSPDAEVDSKPALFIYADDVKCGHGATAGAIDEDTVFYMRSRGLDLSTASRLLIYGFASEVIQTIKPEGLRLDLEQRFLESLPDYRFEF